MADPAEYRPKTSDIPAEPGVYRFLDGEGRIIYVGKAKSLRKRLVSYFRDPQKLHPRTRKMVFSASGVTWVTVRSELEALTLEYAWIKEYTPRYNIMYRDDKSYPYLAVTESEEYPRLMVTRSAHRRGNRYYGPYTQVHAVRESLDLLRRIFPVRTCTKGVFETARKTNRPCLNGFIDKCCAPCVGRVSEEEYRGIIRSLVRYLESDGEELIGEKTRQMHLAAGNLEFETAAKIRDQITALETIARRNTLVLARDTDADIFALSTDELEAGVQVFYVRAGRVRGQRGWITETGGYDAPTLLNSLLIQVYGESARSSAAFEKSGAKSVDDVRHTAVGAIPREIWLPLLPADEEALLGWLTALRGAAVHFRVPQRGIKAQLMQTVKENAVRILRQHKLARIGDLPQRDAALKELRAGLDLPVSPLRIECYDISHTQGTYRVASMVVFEDGMPKKKEYRHFEVHGGDGEADDTAAMNEILTRRLSRLKRENTDLCAQGHGRAQPAESRTDRAAEKPHFAYRPDLIVVDGGLPQVNAAAKAIAAAGVQICVIGLAKRLEEVWIPGEEYPIIFSRSSPALRLLQHLRDESHRFAITFHRRKRAKAMTRSALDEIPGLGEHKQKLLLKKFGSVKRIRNAAPEDLLRVPGIGPKLAQTVSEYLHSHNYPADGE